MNPAYSHILWAIEAEIDFTGIAPQHKAIAGKGNLHGAEAPLNYIKSRANFHFLKNCEINHCSIVNVGQEIVWLFLLGGACATAAAPAEQAGEKAFLLCGFLGIHLLRRGQWVDHWLWRKFWQWLGKGIARER